MTIGLPDEYLSGLVDGIQVGKVQVEEQSIFTVSFNGHLCDGHSRVILRLVCQIDLCIF